MSFEQVGVQLVAEGGPQYFSTMQAADKAVAGFGSTADHTFKQMPGLSDLAVGAFHRVGAMAVEAFAAAGQAVAGFIKDSISVAGDFEAGMNSFAAVAGPALDEAGLSVKDFRDQFIELGKELPVSTADVQQAATEMIKGGIDPATIAAGGLKQNIQFAAAAMGGDLVAAATVSAKILGGWADQGATAEERAQLLTDATDLLTKAANASTVDVKELALGLYNVQGTAKTTGLSLAETTTALAELSPRFASSSEAGTSFKNFLTRLQPTTKPAIAAMEGLGLYTEETGSAFFDAQGKFIGVANASQLLQDATKGLTDAQKVQALQTIFGNDAMNSAAAFAELGAQGFNDMTDAMAKTNGVQANATTMQQGYNTALDNFKGSLEAAQITIGSALLPVLTDLFNNYLSPGINTLTTLAGAVTGDADAFNSLSPTLQAVVVTLGELWIGVQTGVGYLQGLMGSLQSTSDESSVLGGVLTDLGGIWTNLLSAIEAAAAGYQAIIDAVLPIVAGWIGEHGDEIMGFFQESYDAIIEIINTAIDLYEAIVPPVLQAVAKLISDHSALIQDIFTNVWNVISNVIKVALDLIKGILKAALQLIQGDWSGAWDTIKTMSENVVKDLWEIIKAGLGLIANLFGDTLTNIGETWSHNWETFTDGVSRGADALVKLFTDLPDKLAGVGEAIVNSIWDGIKGKWDELVDWFNDKLDELKNQLPFSEPKDPSSPLRGLRKSGAAIVEMIGEGMRSAGPLPMQALVSPTASAAMAGMRAAGSSATYNQQRSVALTYNTAVAPPVQQSYAIAQAIVGAY